MAGKSNDIAKDNSNNKKKKETMMKKNWQKNAQNMNMNIRTERQGRGQRHGARQNDL